MIVTWPIRTKSSANLWEHWRTRARRVKQERGQYLLLSRASLPRPASWPVTVKLVRIAPRRLDRDNLATSFKTIIDSIAEHWGIDDGDETKAQWLFAQERGAPKTYGVRVEVANACANG